MPPRRPLRPPVDLRLRAPKSLVSSITERYWLLRHEGDSHPLFKMSEKKWERRVRDLAQAAKRKGIAGDLALIALCRIDPRFLTTNLVIARVLDWKLQVVFGDIRVVPRRPKSTTSTRPSHDEVKARKDAEDRRRLARARVASARKSLVKLAEAVAFVSGRGNKGYQLRQQVRESFDFYVALFTELRKQLRSSFTDAAVDSLVAEWGVPEKTIRDLKDAPRVEGLADRQLAIEYAKSESRIRALRTQGRSKK